MLYMMIYHDYAPFYDGSGQMRFAVLMGQYLRELLGRHPVPGRQALDLACGTGTLALILADAGWQVVGVDASEPMLALARAKAAHADAPQRLAFVHGDMRALPPGGEQDAGCWLSRFDLVTCTYDSLNYLLREDDLSACFHGVARVLRPGGLFVVDVNTRQFLEHDWGTCEVLERPGFVQVMQSYFEPESACSTMVLTCFVGDDEGGYMRFDETHIERAYEPGVLHSRLAAAGLALEAAYDCFTFEPAHDRSQRIALVARKPDTQLG